MNAGCWLLPRKKVTSKSSQRAFVRGGKGSRKLTAFPLIVCFGVLNSSLTTCSDSNVMKQNPFLWFFVLSNGISTSTIWKIECQSFPFGYRFTIGSIKIISDTYITKLWEEVFNVVVRQFCREAADEDFTVSGLCFLRIDLLVIDYVISGWHDLRGKKKSLGYYAKQFHTLLCLYYFLFSYLGLIKINRRKYLVESFGLGEYDEGETPRSPRIGICLNINTLNISICAKVIS